MKKVEFILLSLVTILIIISSIRLISPREIDDVSPFIPCEKEYFEKASILWIIPTFNSEPISNNKTWCKQILASNKTLGLHGINHTYHEFKKNNITQEELANAIKIFENCFNQTPTIFKAPNLALSKQNKELLKKNNLTIKNPYHQTIHKVYHCNNSGTFPNWFHAIF